MDQSEEAVSWMKEDTPAGAERGDPPPLGRLKPRTVQVPCEKITAYKENADKLQRASVTNIDVSS